MQQYEIIMHLQCDYPGCRKNEKIQIHGHSKMKVRDCAKGLKWNPSEHTHTEDRCPQHAGVPVIDDPPRLDVKLRFKIIDLYFGEKMEIAEVASEIGVPSEWLHPVMDYFGIQKRGKERPKKKEFVATSPNGVIFRADNQAAFARKHGLHATSVWECLNEGQNTHKGWTFEFIEREEKAA